jgi:uncharacterized membrane protein YkoI
LKGVVIGVAAIVALGVGGAAIAGAASGGDGGNDGKDQPITGSALDQASTAALQATSGGKVTGTEVNDEESYYQVEITKTDGTQTDVQLDRAFKVLSQKSEKADGNSGAENPAQ